MKHKISRKTPFIFQLIHSDNLLHQILGEIDLFKKNCFKTFFLILAKLVFRNGTPILLNFFLRHERFCNLMGGFQRLGVKIIHSSLIYSLYRIECEMPQISSFPRICTSLYIFTETRFMPYIRFPLMTRSDTRLANEQFYEGVFFSLLANIPKRRPFASHT